MRVLEAEHASTCINNVTIINCAPSTDYASLSDIFRSLPPPQMPSPGARGTCSPTGIALPTYHGQERLSYQPFDVAELVELRAHQRTFDNAYLRTILATLAYSILVLKIFDNRFYTGMWPTGTAFCESD